MCKKLFPLLACILLCSCLCDNTEESPNYLPLDDSEYPYVNLPRLVIETEDFAQIRDRETEHPAKLQIYGEKSPEDQILDLTIKGRGNSSFTGMPKPSFKISLSKKRSLLGMPKDKDWALIANSADKTMLRNFITFKLARWLGDEYAPRNKFVELYLNRQYQGVYLLTETIKVSKSRVNIKEDGSQFLVEIGPTYKAGHTYFKQDERLYEICFPSQPSSQSYLDLTNHMNAWTEYLKKGHFHGEDSLASWIDTEDFFRYYWIQELSKNLDGARRSIYFTWEKQGVIKMGPVWDFDVAYGNWVQGDTLLSPANWHIRLNGWNQYIFKDSIIKETAKKYWIANHTLFSSITDSISKYASTIEKSASNEFSRWPILENDENWSYKEKYSSYKEAVDSLNSWINQRINWIDNNI